MTTTHSSGVTGEESLAGLAAMLREIATQAEDSAGEVGDMQQRVSGAADLPLDLLDPETSSALDDLASLTETIAREMGELAETAAAAAHSAEQLHASYGDAIPTERTSWHTES